MSHAVPGGYYFTDMAPLSVCVEWPYAYVVGSKNSQGGNYSMESRKLRIDSCPITLEDSYIYLTRSVWTYLFGVSLRGKYLYMAGGYNSGTAVSPSYRYTCIKVDKTNLSNIIWNHDEISVNPGPAYTCYWKEPMANSLDTYVVCIGSGGSYGAAYKLDASTGAKLLSAEGLNPNPQSILGFYNSEAYIDCGGSAGGIKSVRRIQISNWGMTTIGNVTPVYNIYGGELYNGYYYCGGTYYPGSPQYWQKPVWKLLQSTCAETWGRYRDDVALLIQEGNYCSTVDGPGGYVYSCGFQYTATPTIGPLQGTLSKYDLDGNYQWAINYGNNIYPSGTRSLVNYGDYLIGVEVNALVTGTGWLRRRWKSDGSIAVLKSPIPTGQLIQRFA